MALLEKWRGVAYNEKLGKDELQRLWGVYFKREQAIYAELLKNPDEVVKGTVKELAEKYGVDVMTMTGFLDGINDSLVEKNPIEEMEEDTEVNLGFDKELLYKNMVAAEADWLYNLEEWKAIFDDELRRSIYGFGLCLIHDLRKGVQQVVQIEFRQQNSAIFFIKLGLAEEAIHRFCGFQALRAVLNEVVLFEEQNNRVFILFEDDVLFFCTRQDATQFDVEKGRRHAGKIACFFKIKGAHVLYVTKILPRDVGNEDVLDLDLCLLEHVEKEVKRTFKVIQLKAERLFAFKEKLFHQPNKPPMILLNNSSIPS